MNINKAKTLLILILGTILLVTVVLFIVGSFKPKVAGLYVDSLPQSTVFVNGQQVKNTPVRTTTKPGETIVKLVPTSFESGLIPYEAKINLVAGVETVLNVDLGQSDDRLAYETISFEKIGKKETSLVVVTIPDSAQIVIDGRERAFAPHKTSNIIAGKHVLTLSAKGYLERNVEVMTHEGYKLTAVVKLAKSPVEITPTPTPEAVVTETSKVQDVVEILSTGTGFLRVRSEPTSLGNEVGRVDPGKKYPLLETDPVAGWHRIEYLPAQGGTEAKTGWVSGQYAKVIEGQVLTPTPTTSQDRSSSATVSATLTPTKTQTP